MAQWNQSPPNGVASPFDPRRPSVAETAISGSTSEYEMSAQVSRATTPSQPASPPSDERVYQQGLNFWASALKECASTPFPAHPLSVNQAPTSTNILEHVVTLKDVASGATLATIVRAAWALVIGQVTGTRDVVCGMVIPCSPSPKSGYGQITIAPLRLKWKSDQTTLSYLEDAEKSIMDVAHHGYIGFGMIAKSCLGAQRACEFQTLIVASGEENEALQAMSPDTYALVLEILPTHGKVHLRATFDATITQSSTLKRLFSRLEIVMHQLSACSDRKVSDIDLMTAEDLSDLWSWNRTVPVVVERCIHSLIEDQVKSNSEGPAICAWDGNLSYGELDRLASQVAGCFLANGVMPGMSVGLCFDKSMWVPIAQLGVLKAGAIILMLDPSLPEQRLQSIVTQVKVDLAVAAPAYRELGSRLCGRTMVLNNDLFAKHYDVTKPWLDRTDASSVAYIQFSSGSTGVPKGSIISHKSVSSAIQYQITPLGLNRQSRILDFSSYSFDMSFYNTFLALSIGGCLCIPSETGRKNDLAGSIKKLQASVLILTPSTAQLLKPEQVPSVKCIAIGGETLHQRDLAPWWDTTRLVTLYGPSECTPVSLINYDRPSLEKMPELGRGCGVVTWVVDKDDHQRLLPAGCVGELVLEGPLVGTGYLDPQRNVGIYIDDPTWLRRGPPGQVGRRGRLYKTGDLVRRKDDGEIVFLGRKDCQVKIRGQRVELAEVEYSLQQHMPQVEQLAAEVITPKDSAPMLVAFLVYRDHVVSEGIHPQICSVSDYVLTSLAEYLPSYMIPSIFFSVNELPTTASGKLNRKHLQELGASFSLSELAPQGLKEQPTSNMGRQLQAIWARILNIGPAAIGLDDAFLQAGGDSIAAMKVVRDARETGIQLSVTDILSRPNKLRDVVARAFYSTGDVANDIPSFSLLPNGHNVERALQDHGMEINRVEDAYPCTPLQEGLMSLSSKRPGDYIMQGVLELSPGISSTQLCYAWETVVRAVPLLRTRFVEEKNIGLVQVVVDESIDWTHTTGLDEYLEADRAQPMPLGGPLSRFALVSNQQGQVQWFVLTAHHALYDGWSLGLIMDAVDRAYRGEELKPNPSFQSFIQYVLNQPTKAMSGYWQKTLADCEAVPFPALPQSISQPTVDQLITHKLPNPQPHANATISTMIHAAWALVVGCITNSDDVVFGTTVSGRSAAVPGIGDIAGPTIATVPRRFFLSKSQTIDEFLAESQRHATEMIPHEQMGLHRIAKLSADGEQACRFQTLVVIQPEEEARAGSHRLLGKLQERDAMKWSSSYGLVLEVQLGHPHSIVTASFDSRLIETSAVQHLLERLEHVLLNQLGGGPSKTLGDVQVATPEDLGIIWKWNKSVDEPVDMCIHEMMQRNALENPEGLAISAWDGELTYRQLDNLSARLAAHLTKLNVSSEVIVPCCFEKSMWTTVAMMGVLKAGGAFVLLDPSLPQERLENIVAQVDARIILASEDAKPLAFRLAKDVVTINAASLSSLPEAPMSTPSIDSSSAAYVLFTSGSTGTPKGVVVTHSNVASSAPRYIEALNYTSQSRIYDFASYSFGAALSNTFAALITGGCLCVPSEDERRRNLAGSITALRATDVLLTPSVADSLCPEEVPTLRNLVLGGEAVRSQDVTKWWGQVQVRTAYGSSECTTIGVINRQPTSPEDAVSIGFGVGQTTWVVDPDNHNRLLPPGAIGELLLEGPAVAQGYLGDAEKTAAAFIRDPEWLVRGGRRGRLYKSGDLVRYRSDGSLEVLGRKDAQVKIRGQRIELGEVEYWVRETTPRASQVVVEVITPQGPKSRPMLAAFLTRFADPEVDSNQDARLLPIDSRVEAMLNRHLPAFMVPSVFISVAALPMTPSGKISRRQLRVIGSAFSIKDIAQSCRATQGPKSQPVSVIGLGLQKIWAEALNLGLEDVGLDDSFFQLGGDSISAVKIANEARRVGIELLVADIFKHRTLRLIARNSRQSRTTHTASEDIVPFGLLEDGVDVTAFRRYVADQCDVEPSVVQDAYPCTALQEGLVSLAIKRPGDYTMQAVIELSSTVDVNNFKRAWEATVRAAAILRTRIIQDETLGLLQVTLDRGIDWTEAVGLENYLQADRARPLELSLPLTRFALVKDTQDRNLPKWFVWTMHHALYDGWSLPLLLDSFNTAYLGQTIPKEPDVRSFMKYMLSQISSHQASDYWRAALSDCESALFPPVPSSISSLTATDFIHHTVSRLKLSTLDMTPSALVRAAWGLVVSRMTNSDDVVFGVTVSGRNAPVRQLDRMTAPTIATVPVRVRPRQGVKVFEYLRSVQQQAIDMIPFEQTGLPKIMKTCPGAKQACMFQTLLVVQPQNHSSTTEYSFGTWRDHDQKEWFSTYALMIEVQVGISEFHVNASFDARVVQPRLVNKLLKQFELVIGQLAEVTPRQTVRQIDTMTGEDLEELWAWNHQVPESRGGACLHQFFERQAVEQPEKQAVCARDGSITYKQLNELSSTLASQLGNCSGILVPLCFEKSMWTSVAILATLKAGGAFVLLDASLPQERLKTIVSQTKSQFIISSNSQASLSAHLADTVIQAGPRLLTAIPDPNFRAKYPPTSSPMYAVFTSGSTGTPKGALLSHANFASGLHHQLSLLGFNSSSRVFDFASYAFDAAVHNAFAAFTLGGCLCVPSDDERKGGFEKAMSDMHVTIANLTPSVSRLLTPEALPHLQTLILGGEELTLSDAKRWHGSHLSMVNAYGPAECAVISIINPGGSALEDMLHIGKGAGLVAWVVDPDDHEVLLPAGSTGELLLEGPLVGLGYLNDPSKTAASFIENPAWLAKGCMGFPGRQGRMYKTGDLVRYNENGMVTFMGRKDAQVKIRGQRVELGDVECHVASCFPHAKQVACEIAPIEGKPTLVAFLEMKNEAISVLKVDATIEDTLVNNLPNYMVPSGFFKMGKLPMTPTGKLHRKYLRELAAGFTLEQFESESETEVVRRQPLTDMEHKMQQIWCRALNLSAERVGLDDNFFRLGGDSITAIKVISEAHKQGIMLQVDQIFKHPSLGDAASRAQFGNPYTVTETIAPFALLDAEDGDELTSNIASQYGLDPGTIEDAFPCTPLQQGLISLTSKRPGAYVMQAIIKLASSVFTHRFKEAWETVSRSIPALRTRIVQYKSMGLLQVVLNENIQWAETSDVESYLEADRAQSMDLGEPLTRYAIIETPTGAVYFVWTIHHALYDGWSLRLIFQAVESALRGEATRPWPQFQPFIKYMSEKDDQATTAYWRDKFTGCVCTQFPTIPSGVNQILPDQVVETILPQPQPNPQLGITTSALIHAAWALVLGSATTSTDVVFGTTLSGRNAPVPNIESVPAPTLATVPTRIVIPSASVPVSVFLHSVQSQATEQVPFEQTGLHRIAKMSEECAQACAFQTLLLVNLEATADATTAPLTFGERRDHAQTEWFNTHALMVEVSLGRDDITVHASFDSRVIERWMVTKLVSRLRSVLKQISSEGEEKKLMGDIEVMTEEDREEIWKWNSNDALPEKVDRCIHDMVDHVIQQQPDAQAIESWDGSLTYGDLGRLSDNLASQLTQAGISGVVPLCFEKSMWTPVAMLAVLKMGAAFVLLNPSLPEQRLKTMVNQVNSDTIISSVANRDLSLRLARSIVIVGPSLLNKSSSISPQIQRRRQTQPSDTMFVVFTSGSTGTPKGVIISHSNFASSFHHQLGKLGFNDKPRVFDFASYSFDVSVHNTFGAFVTRGCVCIPSDEEREGDITATMRRLRVTIADFTPTVSRLLDASKLPDMKTLILLGEAVTPEDALRWRSHQIDAIHTYGPTETTVLSTINNISQTPQEFTRIGWGAGLVTWIVHPDNHDILLPPGCVGELLLEGPLVGQGYLHDAEKTAAAFIHDPVWLAENRSGRMYKTGDLVRYNQDGSLSFVGRKDLQVKIRGQRIELGEVEHCLRSVIDDAELIIVEAVTLKEDGIKTLAAFVVWADKAKRSDEAESFSPQPELMGKMREHLSTAMIPTIFVSLPSLPLTPTGKTDRKHLREKGASLSAQQLLLTSDKSYTTKARPSTTIQKQVHEIWADVLDLDLNMVGLDDNFARLGGDSIAAMKVVGSARQMCLNISVADMFRFPRLRDLTSSPHLVADTKAKPDPIPRVEEMTVVQSFAQGRLWFMDQLYPGLTWYHMPMAMRLRGNLKLDALELALQAMQQRHETLRTTFETRDGVHLQHIQPFRPKPLDIVDLSSSHGDIDAALQEHHSTPFDLTREPGWRVRLYRLKRQSYILSMVMHHIVSDGWSLQILRRDLEALYKAALTQRDPLSRLKPLPIQYRDYAVWQKTQSGKDSYQRQLDYWEEKLQNSRPAEILCDKQRPRALSGESGLVEFKVEGQAYARLQNFYRGLQVTPFNVLLAAFRATHYRLTGVEDATIGTPNANRSQTELDDMIGFFVNIQPLRLKLEGSSSFADLVQHVYETTTESFDNQDVPFEQIVARLRRDRDLSRHPIVQIVFALHAEGIGEPINLEGLTSEMLDAKPTSRFDLELHMFEVHDALQGALVYSTDLYDDSTIRNLVSIFLTILESGLDRPESKVATLELLTNESCARLEGLGVLKVERTTYPRESSVTDVFTEQAKANPENIAVKDSCTALTYAELERQSTLVARWLARRGFAQETPIPVMAHRSCETVIAFLGILKAGLAYLPMDVRAPVGRIETLLSQVQKCGILIVGRGVVLPGRLMDKLDCKHITDMIHDEEGHEMAPPMAPAPGPKSLAYILFTSGSTGTPKGVMIDHRAILRLCVDSNITHYLAPKGAIAHMASLVFDGSTLEIYAALLNGLTVICLDHEVVLDHAALYKAFTQEDHPIRAAFVTPAHLKQILLAAPQILGGLHVLMVGGERSNPEDYFQAWSVMPPGSHFLHVYGPTENTIYSTFYRLDSNERATNGIPIGRAVSNSGAYVLNPEQRLVPLGVLGELVVTGDGLARGYTDVERNKDRFVDIAIHGAGEPAVRAYRTGDYVRWRPSDGQIEFLGRMDIQVKIRGHRIELGEIDNVLREHNAVADAVVLAYQRDGGQSAQLFGFVTTRDVSSKIVTDDAADTVDEEATRTTDEKGSDEIHIANDDEARELSPSLEMRQGIQEQLKERLKENLPSYMIPQKLVILDQMPISMSGKVDRKALAAMIHSWDPVSKDVVRQPATEAENSMQDIWARVLGVEASSIGLDDNFFQIGGDSISAMRVVSEARKMDIELTVADVFRSDSLEKLAVACSHAQPVLNGEGQQPLVHPNIRIQLLLAIDKGSFANFSSADVADILPTTSMQQRYFREGEAHGQFAHYFFFDLGHIDAERLRTSCIQTLEALPILRARFLPLLGKLWQVIPRQLDVPFFIQHTDQSLEKVSDEFCRADIKTTSPIEPPCSFTLLQNKTRGSRLIMRLSHAQYDGACIPFIIQSLVDGYLDQPTPRGPDYSRFLCHAAHHRAGSLDYWSQLLRGTSSPASLMPRLRYSALRDDVPRQVRVTSQVTIPNLPKGITTATLSSAAWALLLSRLNGSKDVVYGHVVTGRNAAVLGLSEIVGACLNIVPVRARLTASQTATSLLSELQDQFASMGSADTVGYEDIISECTEWPTGAQFDHIIHHANIDEHPEFELGDKKFHMDHFHNSELVLDYVAMFSYPLGERVQFDLLTQTAIMSPEVAQGVVDGLCAIVQRLGEANKSIFTWLEDLDLKI